MEISAIKPVLGLYNAHNIINTKKTTGAMLPRFIMEAKDTHPYKNNNSRVSIIS